MKKILTLLILSFLMCSSSSIAQMSGDGGSAEIASKVKRYADSKKKITVTPISGDQVKGYVSTFDREKFTITDSKSGQATTFRYGDVKRLRKTNSLTTGGIVAIVAAGAGAAIVLGLVGIRCRNEGGC